MFWSDIWRSICGPVDRALGLAERAIAAYERRASPENILARNIVEYSMQPPDGEPAINHFRTVVDMARGHLK
jgi:hypothetical protein